MSGPKLDHGTVRGNPWCPIVAAVVRPDIKCGRRGGALLLTIRLEVEVMVDQLDREDDDAAGDDRP